MSDSPIAGWYPDPRDPTRWRWWNGADWTADTAARPAPAALSPSAAVPILEPAAAPAAADPAAPVRRALDWSDAGPTPYRTAAAIAASVSRPPAGWTWFMVFGGYVYAIFAAVFQAIALPISGYSVPVGSAVGVDYGQAQLALVASLVAWVVAVIPMVVIAAFDGRSLQAHGVAAPSGLLMFLVPNVVYYLVRRSRLARAGVRFRGADITFFVIYGLQLVSVIVGVVVTLTILPTLVGLPLAP